ncbi:hypothetical protein GCM10027321_36510 [Massilia terrae]|uniref:MFS transporter n=1 Tax=Massilia terrae TaxID=1811224 RepID=A0ABT2D3S8_9BURK|nr:hypothetical protein [Massilia terrae]MCS0660769.1 hypothetical protein [Massilia terrae]
MNQTLQNILNELTQIVSALQAFPGDQPFSIAQNNWTFPGITKDELVAEVNERIDLIRTRAPTDLGIHEKPIGDYVRRLAYLRQATIPNFPGNPGAGAPAFFITLNGLSKALAPALKTDNEVAQEISQATKRITTRLRAIESRLNDSDPRSEQLTEMVERIEKAYQAADQLPLDLDALSEGRNKLSAILEAAQIDRDSISEDQVAVAAVMARLSTNEAEAKSVLEACHSAYAAATSQGLAAAFTERSKALATSMWIWTAAFIVALIAGAFFGAQRVHEIGELLKSPAMTNWALSINLLLAALSVGAPIWFGWMATKQINQRFRLSEDYAFKASVSRAYEGYRREAARIDKDMEARLLASALTRLDEQPLRFVEMDNHGTPWHELASSDFVKSAMRSVPGFADKVIELARSAVQPNTKPAANDPSKTVAQGPESAATPGQ